MRKISLLLLFCLPLTVMAQRLLSLDSCRALALRNNTMLDEGLPQDLPIGVVDQDNSATSRGLVPNLDAMQNSRVVYRFADVTEARSAMQEGKVFAYLYIPKGTAAYLSMACVVYSYQFRMARRNAAFS